MRVRLFAFIFITVGVAAQAMAQWVEPGSGLVFDQPTRSIRQIAGFLGAAQLSKPLVENLDWAAVAPNGRRALASTPAGDLLWLEGIGEADSSPGLVTPPGPPPYMAHWNATSTAIRLYSAGCSCFFTITLKSGQPVLSGNPQYLDSEFGSVRDFFWKYSQTVAATESGLYEMRGGAQPRVMATADTGVSFLLEGSGKAWAVREPAGEVSTVVLQYGRESERKIVATDPERLTDVSAIVSVPGAIFAADRKTQSIFRIALDSGAIDGAWELDAPPGRLTLLSNRSAWLIGERGRVDEPMYIFDCSTGPRVFFVPGEGAQQ